MKQLRVGGLYSYNNHRAIYSDREGIQNMVGILEINEPFVLLEDGGEQKWSMAWKVLTAQGIVGWIHIGYPEHIRELSAGQ